MKCKKEKSYTVSASFFKLFGSISLKQTGSSLANTPPSKNIFWNLSFGFEDQMAEMQGERLDSRFFDTKFGFRSEKSYQKHKHLTDFFLFYFLLFGDELWYDWSKYL